jgi:hypothetical protein
MLTSASLTLFLQGSKTLQNKLSEYKFLMKHVLAVAAGRGLFVSEDPSYEEVGILYEGTLAHLGLDMVTDKKKSPRDFGVTNWSTLAHEMRGIKSGSDWTRRIGQRVV